MSRGVYRRYGFTATNSNRRHGEVESMGRERELDPRVSAIAQYGYRLRYYRKKANLSQDALGARFGVTGQMIGHIETAKRPTTPEMSKGFDELFGLDAYFEELWWHVRREQTPSWFRDYVAAEARAASIRLFDPLMIPGLLQTEAYAREVLRAGQPEDKLEQLVAARLARQEMLQREEPPWLVFVISEFALRRMVGNPDIMRDQYARLLELAERPNITIHVLPDNAAVYPSGGLTIFSFDEAPDLGYAEAVRGQGVLIEQRKSIEVLRVEFDLVRSAALSADASVDLIRSLMEGT
ncbi:helix-turn-helix domain-containing protein [Actinoallomurus rhizosphaericola]|uniref:helix-turn-helix domain-containing protein n=1 Tax=Actinoallomurus rhizosphaericola TaxID=2952536 RepID=UPI0020931F8C|nr:helix-turn-helix transcriptional regulator [Actinoallomurus rhizosphaericola]MCO5997640.1 helix-turn-helix transcriptional regulator [Actinoallomurus rhizosphaericola]